MKREKNTGKTLYVQMNTLDSRKTHVRHSTLHSHCHESQNSDLPILEDMILYLMKMNHHSSGKLFEKETKLFDLLPSHSQKKKAEQSKHLDPFS